eukprot:Protomagalhaensia_wolfi_Nauph_80__403@NODE_1222_length_1649_cov_103_701863_g723_i1_p2_GENE_NODE_1222_length_1649_cov_103_701863_g723_i1NODE_1222_length_1649_cov_103_701863_g723_i1_p2_ORF_typecomplete_len153_score10_51_NODE_1222_length_1649_cov_103_701863_g723_i1253711
MEVNVMIVKQFAPAIQDCSSFAELMIEDVKEDSCYGTFGIWLHTVVHSSFDNKEGFSIVKRSIIVQVHNQVVFPFLYIISPFKCLTNLDAVKSTLILTSRPQARKKFRRIGFSIVCQSVCFVWCRAAPDRPGDSERDDGWKKQWKKADSCGI